MKNFLFLFILVLCASCNTSSTELAEVEKGELQKLLTAKADIQLLDVRTEREFNQGHIEGAIHIDIKNDDFLDKARHRLDKTKPVYLYCKRGSRSTKAGELLLKEKFDTVYCLDGGYTSWKQNE